MEPLVSSVRGTKHPLEDRGKVPGLLLVFLFDRINNGLSHVVLRTR